LRVEFSLQLAIRSLIEIEDTQIAKSLNAQLAEIDEAISALEGRRIGIIHPMDISVTTPDRDRKVI